MATQIEHMLGSTNYKSSWNSLHHVYTTLEQVTVLHTEATTNTPDMTWQQIMQRQGRHTTGYTVLNKAEIDTLLQSRRITNIFRKDRRHIIVDSSVQDAVNTAAFDVSMGYMTVHNEEEDRDEWYIVQFEIDYSNLIDSIYNKTVSIYRRGYSSVSWQVLTEYTLVDMEHYNTTIYKVMGDALQPYRELTWNGGYMWKQQKALRVMTLLQREPNDRHHVLVGQCFEEHGGHALKHYRDTGNAAYMHMMVDYMFKHHMSMNIPDDRLEQHPGHPGYAEYIREELLHGRLLGTQDDTVEDMTVDTMTG